MDSLQRTNISVTKKKLSAGRDYFVLKAISKNNMKNKGSFKFC